jgi:glycosyltransferase involved in cell wall biosynthesis
MRISVILWMYNRCQTLPNTLSSVAASNLPESVEWEVLVVHNNSSDQTRHVVQEFCRRHPGRVRYLFEPRQGKSHALNTGVREARGQVLAFVDEDVTVEPSWLHNLTAPLKDAQWARTGGRTLLERGCSPPPWLGLREPYNLRGVLARFDAGERPSELARPPAGTNMAFRREMFQKYGSFRTDLGRWPGSLIGREDTEFANRLLAAGERIRYEPSAVVCHAVPENRVRKDYFLN